MSANTIQTGENGTVSVSKPRKTNAELRSREFLHRHEVETLIELAKQNKRGGGNPIGNRHALMIMMAFNHGLRASELVDIRWSQLDFKSNTLSVTRLKGSESGTHMLNTIELRMLKKLQAQKLHPEFVFPTERNAPMTIRGFHKLVAELGIKSNMPFTIHPHMLRHAKGYDLANRGTDCLLIQAYLGHKDIRNTVRYTKLSATRLKGLEA